MLEESRLLGSQLKQGVDPGWFQALTLEERLRLLGPHPCVDGADLERGRRRLARWRDKCHLQEERIYSRWLAQLNATEDQVLQALAVTPDVLQQLCGQMPPWLESLLEILQQGAPAPCVRWPNERSSPATFANVVRPLLNHHVGRLEAHANALPHRLRIEPVVSSLVVPIATRLGCYSYRTIVVELDQARQQGMLSGDTPEQRFDSFIDLFRDAAVTSSFLQAYPVLARQCLGALTQWLASSTEFLTRLTADYDAIRQTLANLTDIGPLTAVEAAGDAHRNGRRVLICQFESGFRAVYKPRSLSLDQHFLELVAWLNERGQHPPLRAPQVLDRGDYGWTEFVTARGCEDTVEVDAFYRRIGAWAALLYALAAVDFHAENLLADGAHPVLIDLEALFHLCTQDLAFETAHDAAKFLLDDSVLSIGLLPVPQSGEERYDISGIGGNPDQESRFLGPMLDKAGTDELIVIRKRYRLGELGNQTALAGAVVSPGAWTSSIEAGFSDTWNCLLAHQSELERWLPRVGNDTTRCILRSTELYGALLMESWHPDLLSDGLSRDLLLDHLWQEADQEPALIDVIASELRQMRVGDIPYFHVHPNSTDVVDPEGTVFAQRGARCGLDIARQRLARMRSDFAFQSWLLKGSLSSLDHARCVRGSSIDAGYLPSPLEAVREIANQLKGNAISYGNTATWHVVDCSGDSSEVQRFQFSVAGCDLYGGLPGLALFLAYADAAGASTRDVAEAAINMLHHHLERHPPTSVGAFNGWGGILYLWAHAGTLWQRDDLLDRAVETLPRLQPMIDNDLELDVIGGAAGAIVCLLALHRARAATLVMETAVRCGKHLTQLCAPQAVGLGWPQLSVQRGLSHGTAGLAWALLELARASGEREFAHVAMEALRWEDSLIADGQWTATDRQQATWCHGAPGLALSRLAAWRLSGDDTLLRVARAALQATLQHPQLSAPSLCHGELGNLEPIMLAQELLPADDALSVALNDRISALLARHPWRTTSLSTPGLMTGLSGVGYGLLRAAHLVPSVLLLEPPAQKKAVAGFAQRGSHGTTP